MEDQKENVDQQHRVCLQMCNGLPVTIEANGATTLDDVVHHVLGQHTTDDEATKTFALSAMGIYTSLEAPFALPGTECLLPLATKHKKLYVRPKLHHPFIHDVVQENEAMLALVP